MWRCRASKIASASCGERSSRFRTHSACSSHRVQAPRTAQYGAVWQRDKRRDDLERLGAAAAARQEKLEQSLLVRLRGLGMHGSLTPDAGAHTDRVQTPREGCEGPCKGTRGSPNASYPRNVDLARLTAPPTSNRSGSTMART